MTNPTGIENRRNISDEVATRLRDMIYEGELADGERINEVHLSARLGVSRTPLREALTMLVAENALISIPRRGCFVRELTHEEFEDIYAIRALLEPEALRLAGIPPAAGLRNLERLQQKIRSTRAMPARMSLDETWHLDLLAGCPNGVLLDLVRHFIHRFRRYGRAFARERTVIESANVEHAKILGALRSGDLTAACSWLRRNLSSNKEPILEWLNARRGRPLSRAI